MILAQRVDVTVVVDAHVQAKDAERYQQAITEHAPQLAVALVDRLSPHLGGMLVIWNAQRWHIEVESVPVPGRVAALSLWKANETGIHDQRWHLLAAYMPVRQAAVQEDDRETWDQLRAAISAARTGHSPVYVVGDLNAEPEEWVERRNRRLHWSDEQLRDVCHDYAMTPLLHEEATYAAGTLIDNVIAPVENTSDLRAVYTVPGVSDADRHGPLPR